MMSEAPQRIDPAAMDLEQRMERHEVWTLPNDGSVSCDLHQYHSPEVVSFDIHHVIPKSMGGPDTQDNKAVVCPTGHRNVHTLLRVFASVGPDAADRVSWGEETWNMAMKGWIGGSEEDESPR